MSMACVVLSAPRSASPRVAYFARSPAERASVARRSRSSALGSEAAATRALGTSRRLAAPAQASSFRLHLWMQSPTGCARARQSVGHDSKVHVPRRLRPFAVILVALSPAGCGRPATIADCDEIVAKIAELELKGAKMA